jgi:hypothetical protein
MKTSCGKCLEGIETEAKHDVSRKGPVVVFEKRVRREILVVVCRVSESGSRLLILRIRQVLK